MLLWNQPVFQSLTSINVLFGAMNVSLKGTNNHKIGIDKDRNHLTHLTLNDNYIFSVLFTMVYMIIFMIIITVVVKTPPSGGRICKLQQERGFYWNRKLYLYFLDNKTQEHDGFEVVAVFKWLTTQAPISTVPMFQLQKWQYFSQKSYLQYSTQWIKIKMLNWLPQMTNFARMQHLSLSLLAFLLYFNIKLVFPGKAQLYNRVNLFFFNSRIVFKENTF